MWRGLSPTQALPAQLILTALHPTAKFSAVPPRPHWSGQLLRSAEAASPALDLWPSSFSARPSWCTSWPLRGHLIDLGLHGSPLALGLAQGSPCQHGGQAWPCVSLATPWVSLEIQVSSMMQTPRGPYCFLLSWRVWRCYLEWSNPMWSQPGQAWASVRLPSVYYPGKLLDFCLGPLGQAWVQATSETRAAR